MKKIAVGVLGILLVAGIVSALPNNTKKPAPISYKGTLVALGDSVAAGDGLATDSDSSACNRTQEAYPNIIARKQNLRLNSYACSGATVSAGLTGEQDVNKLMVAPQIEQINQQEQITDVTLTIGANDAGWTEFLQKCYTAVCGSDEDTALVTERLTAMQSDLTSLLNQVADKFTVSSQRTYVTGYYQVVPTSGACSDLTGLDAGELAWIRSMQASIGSSVEAAVQDAPEASFVAIDFSGHGLCSTDPWVQGLQDKAPYHPTAKGQEQIAKQLLAVMQKATNL